MQSIDNPHVAELDGPILHPASSVSALCRGRGEFSHDCDMSVMCLCVHKRKGHPIPIQLFCHPYRNGEVRPLCLLVILAFVTQLRVG